MPQLAGEQHSKAKLTEGDVVRLRERYAAGGTSFIKLAAEHGIETSTTRSAIRGETWQHVPGAVTWRVPVRPVTHCLHDHEFTPENTIWRPSRRDKSKRERQCRTCHNATLRKASKIKRGYK